jgi:hypothetical protein
MRTFAPEVLVMFFGTLCVLGNWDVRGKIVGKRELFG